MTIRPFPVSLAIALGMLIAVSSVKVVHTRAAAPRRLQASGPASLPDGAGKEVVEKVCSACHGLEFLAPSERTVQVWREIVDAMRGYGAEASDDQWAAITNYIVVNLAYLNANKGTADEVRLFFAVDQTVADGVVAYREKQGGFKTIDDLKKAPGLEAAKVDALQERVKFE